MHISTANDRALDISPHPSRIHGNFTSQCQISKGKRFKIFLRLMAAVDKVTHMDEKILQSLLERMDALEQKVDTILTHIRKKSPTRKKYRPKETVDVSFFARLYRVGMSAEDLRNAINSSRKWVDGNWKNFEIVEARAKRLLTEFKNERERKRYINLYPYDELKGKYSPPPER